MGILVRLLIFITVISFLTSVPVFPARARLMKVPSYQELMDKSDLVAIATPITKTTDTKEVVKAFLPSISSGDKYIGTETIFKISAVLKGEKTIKRFTLHHYRDSQSIEINGPSFVFFDSSDLSKRSDYLLFLSREPDGRYAPTGGQTDPAYKVISRLPVAE